MSIFTNSFGQDLKNVPDFKFIDWKGKSISNKDIKRQQGMFVYFDPLCDVCKKETKIIKEHLSYFQDKPMYMVSPGKLKDIEAFIKQYDLGKVSFIKIIPDQKDQFYKIFNVSGYPSIIIWNSNNEITAKFEGETSFEEIKNAFEKNAELVNSKNSDSAPPAH